MLPVTSYLTVMLYVLRCTLKVHTETVQTRGCWPQVVSYTTVPLLLTCHSFNPFSSSFLSVNSTQQACATQRKENHTDHMHQTRPHLYTYVDTQSLASFSQPAYTHWLTHTHMHAQTPKQIKAYPPTVVVALQDDEGLDPKYQLISADQWLTSQLATARLTNTA